MQSASTSSSTSNLSFGLKYPSSTIKLHQSNEIELVHVLENGFKKNFEDVTVHWTICPDLSQEPYNLAAKGIYGEKKFVEIGDKSYLDSAQTRKLFYLKDVVKHFSTEQSLIFGQNVSQCPGGNLGQMITNASFSKEISINKSGVISAKSRKCNFKSVLNDDFGFNCTKHGTFFLCEGLNKPVLKVCATKYRSTVPEPSFTNRTRYFNIQ